MQPTPLLFLSLCMLTACFQASAQLASDESNTKEVNRILLRIREIDEAGEVKRAELQRRTTSMVDALIRGDYTQVDTAAAQKDVDALWYVFGRSMHRGIGVGEFHKTYGDTPEFMPALESFNKRVSTYLRPKIAAIPGHAKMLGDRIEMMSQEAGYYSRREGTLRQLALLGSMEAIQQIGRFLEDTRNPDSAIIPVMIDGGVSPPRSNLVDAAYAMIKALGDASPVQLSKALSLSESDRRTLQQWWKSDAAKPYREWTYETELPMPPPRPRPVAALPPKAPAQMAAASQSPPVLSAADQSHVERWLLWVVVAGVSAAILLAMRGRRRP